MIGFGFGFGTGRMIGFGLGTGAGMGFTTVGNFGGAGETVSTTGWAGAIVKVGFDRTALNALLSIPVVGTFFGTGSFGDEGWRSFPAGGTSVPPGRSPPGALLSGLAPVCPAAGGAGAPMTVSEGHD
jgi:hypothetical protein